MSRSLAAAENREKRRSKKRFQAEHGMVTRRFQPEMRSLGSLDRPSRKARKGR
jgi:hypothetical protein